MARMHPEVLGPAGRLGRADNREPSNAERMVFEEIARQFDDQWDGYYSVWFRDTAPGEHAEADFALVGPEGVLLIEVKGGEVERLADGQWRFTNRFGEVVKVTGRGPFNQVRDAWYAMKSHVRATCGDEFVDECIWGYAVVTPECQIRMAGPDPSAPQALWLDSVGFPEQLRGFVDSVICYWRADIERRSRSGHRPRNLTLAERLRLQRALTPVVRCVVGAGVEAREIGRTMRRLTTEQCSILDHLQLDPRLVIQGGAGTGKTLVALEQARREVAASRRVLYVCFNRLLADHVSRGPHTRSMTIGTYHQFVMRLLRDAGITVELPSSWPEFNAATPDLVLEALERLGERFVSWDYLVVDEAQDLMTEGFFSVLELVLRGGLSGGRWLMCLDTEQAIFSSQFDQAYYERFLGHAGARRGQLSINCRNTKQIAAYGHAIGAVPHRSCAPIIGRMPNIDYYTNHADLRRKVRSTVNRLVAEFRAAMIPESHITVLIGKREPYEALVINELRGCIAQPQLLRADEIPDPRRIQVSTIQAYKGLEADAVVLLGIDNLAEQWQRKLFYVASTRARAVLEILLPETEQGAVGQESLAIALQLAVTADTEAHGGEGN